MSTPHDNLAAWLRDAYAMEGQAIELLESQIQRLENYPQALPRLREHLEETKAQQAAIEQCLEQLGESPSSFKEMTMKLGANVQGMLHGLAGDEVLKHALGSHAFEQFEAGCYRSLNVAAEAAGEPQIAQTCSRLMEQEQAMAAWLWEQIPTLTRTFIERDATGGAAKR
jgi:ferritin-like metal-binding protein YciE